MSEPSRRVQRAARRLADQQSSRISELPTSRLLIATVTTVTAGTSTDGRAVVSVTYRGEELDAAAYNRQQTFVVGDRVLCALVDNQLVITFALGGFPPEL